MSTKPLIALIAGVALLVGCGGGADSTPKPTAAGGSVEDQLGFSRTGIQAAQGKVENEIAACMKEQGFDYVPVDPVAAQAALTGKPNLTDSAFEKQFGHGISTLYDRASTQTDPNARIRLRLTPAERRDYDTTLSGAMPEQTFFLAVDTGDFSKLGGCTKQATDKLFGGAELLTTLQRKLDELDESILADQRMVRAGEAWTRCMRDATGTSYEDSEAVEEDIRRRLVKIVGPPPPPGQVAAKRNHDRAALAALQRTELKLTNADVACERKHISDVEDVVRAEKEARFRDANAALLRKVKPLGT